jgi:hypothetical protein
MVVIFIRGWTPFNELWWSKPAKSKKKKEERK